MAAHGAKQTFGKFGGSEVPNDTGYDWPECRLPTVARCKTNARGLLELLFTVMNFEGFD